jgi:hypothetical protein
VEGEGGALPLTAWAPLGEGVALASAALAETLCEDEGDGVNEGRGELDAEAQPLPATTVTDAAGEALPCREAEAAALGGAVPVPSALAEGVGEGEAETLPAEEDDMEAPALDECELERVRPPANERVGAALAVGDAEVQAEAQWVAVGEPLPDVVAVPPPLLPVGGEEAVPAALEEAQPLGCALPDSTAEVDEEKDPVTEGVAVREALTVGDALAVPVAPPEVHAVADAEGEPLPLPLAQGVARGEPLAAGVPVRAPLPEGGGDALPQPLAVAQAVEGAEPLGDAEAAGESDADAVRCAELLPPAVPLTEPVALWEGAPPVTLPRGVADPVTEGESDSVSRPLRVVLLVAQREGVALAEGVAQGQALEEAHAEGVAEAMGVGPPLPEAGALPVAAAVEVVELHAEGVGVPPVAQGDAEAVWGAVALPLLLCVGEGGSLPVPSTALTEGDALAQAVVTALGLTLAEQHAEGDAKELNEALCEPDAVPLPEERGEGELLRETDALGEAVELPTVPRALTDGEAFGEVEALLRGESDSATEGELLTAPVDEAAPRSEGDGAPLAEGVNEGKGGELPQPLGVEDAEAQRLGDALAVGGAGEPLAALEALAHWESECVADPEPDGEGEREGCEGDAAEVALPQLLTDAEREARDVGKGEREANELPLGDKEALGEREVRPDMDDDAEGARDGEPLWVDDAQPLALGE